MTISIYSSDATGTSNTAGKFWAVISTSWGGGILVPKSQANMAYGLVLAPLQGVKRRSGSWSAVAPNYVSFQDAPNNIGIVNQQLGYGPATLTTTILENGPLRARIQCRYVFNRLPIYMQGYSGNNAFTTLAVAIGTSDTTISLNSYPSDWPTSGTFYLSNNHSNLSGEVMQVTGGQGTLTLTVVRAVGGSTATGIAQNGNIYLAVYDPSTTNDGYYECDLVVDDALPLVKFTDSCNAQFFYRVELNEGVAADTALTMSHSYMGGQYPNNWYALMSSVQTINVPAAATGTYTLTVGANTTTALSVSATAAQIQAALVALASVGAGNVLVTNPASSTGTDENLSANSYAVAFRRSMGGQFVSLITVNNGGITNGPVTVSFANNAELYVLQLTGSSGNPTGTFTLSYGGNTTGAITISDVDTTRSNIVTALTGLASIGANNANASKINGATNVSNYVPANTFAYRITIGQTLINTGSTTPLTATAGTGNTTVVSRKVPIDTNFNVGYPFPDNMIPFQQLDINWTPITYNHFMQNWNIFERAQNYLFYQAAATTTHDAVGILPGQASLNVGGPSITPITAPGADDFDMRVDSSGNIHLLWKEWISDAVYYAKYSSTYTQVVAPTLLGNFEAPCFVLRDTTNLSVFGINWQAGTYIQVDFNGTTATTRTVTLDNTFVPQQPYLGPLFTYDNAKTNEFLIVTGSYNNGSNAFHLFQRAYGTTGTWNHKDTSGVSSTSAVPFRSARPRFELTTITPFPIWFISSNGTDLFLETIAATTTVFATPKGQRLSGSHQVNGLALDRITGNVLAPRPTSNTLGYWIASSQTWNADATVAYVNYQAANQDPCQRDSVANNTGGTVAIATVNSNCFLFASSAWSEWTAFEALANANSGGTQPRQLINKYEALVSYEPVMAWNATSTKFNMLGMAGGKLTLWDFDGTTITQRVQLSVRQSLTAMVSGGRTTPIDTYTPYSQNNWGLHLATVDDVGHPLYELAPYNFSQLTNRSTGFNLSNVSQWKVANPATPYGGWGGTYMPEADFLAILNKIANGSAAPTAGYASYYAYLYATDTGNRFIWDALSNHGAFNANSYSTVLANFYQNALNRFYQVWNGIGSMGPSDSAMQYIGLGYNTLRDWFTARVLLIFPWTVPLLATDIAKIKSFLATYAYLCNSNDLAPLQPPYGYITLGTANMPIQMQSYRNAWALAFGTISDLAAQAALVATQSINTFNLATDSNGTSIGSSSYMAATLSPTLYLLLQVKQAGTDWFANSPSRFNGLANYLQQLSTPQQARLNNHRMIVCFGDSLDSDDASFLAGVLGTGLRDSNLPLAKSMMGCWHAFGAQPDGAAFFGSTVDIIDDSITAATFTLTSWQQPGIFMTQRFNWGTATESAVWGFWGNTYFDHRHVDYGQITAYLLGCPLLVDWTPEYSPHMSTAYVHNVVMPEANLNGGQTWAAALTGASAQVASDTTGTYTQTQDFFAAFTNSSCMQGTSTDVNGLVWKRRVRTLWFNNVAPVILIEDTFSGTGATATKVCSFNVSATGAVSSPAGSYTPTVNFYNQGGLQNYPAGGTVNTNTAGGSPTVYKWSFTGPVWQQSTSLSTSCDAYSILQAGNAEDWFIGGWGFSGVSSPAATYYTQVNNANAYSESFAGVTNSQYREQCHIWRRRSTKPFTTLLAPYIQATGAHWVTITAPGSSQVHLAGPGSEVMDLYANFMSYTNGAGVNPTIALATLDTASQSAYGLVISGGETEVMAVGVTSATATVHSTSSRTVSITLPSGHTWVPGTPTAGLSVSGTSPNFTLNYTAGAPASVTFS